MYVFRVSHLPFVPLGTDCKFRLKVKKKKLNKYYKVCLENHRFSKVPVGNLLNIGIRHLYLYCDKIDIGTTKQNHVPRILFNLAHLSFSAKS